VSGRVVNDSPVMTDFFNRKPDRGSGRDAIIQGAGERSRAITLTRVTAFLGFIALIPRCATQIRPLASFSALMGLRIPVTTTPLMLIVPALTATHLRKRIRADG